MLNVRRNETDTLVSWELLFEKYSLFREGDHEVYAPVFSQSRTLSHALRVSVGWLFHGDEATGRVALKTDRLDKSFSHRRGLAINWAALRAQVSGAVLQRGHDGLTSDAQSRVGALGRATGPLDPTGKVTGVTRDALDRPIAGGNVATDASGASRSDTAPSDDDDFFDALFASSLPLATSIDGDGTAPLFISTPRERDSDHLRCHEERDVASPHRQWSWQDSEFDAADTVARIRCLWCVWSAKFRLNVVCARPQPGARAHHCSSIHGFITDKPTTVNVLIAVHGTTISVVQVDRHDLLGPSNGGAHAHLVSSGCVVANARPLSSCSTCSVSCHFTVATAL